VTGVQTCALPISIKNFKIESDDIKKISDSINQSFKKTEELIRLAVNEKLDF
jgi:hypothetical protein